MALAAAAPLGGCSLQHHEAPSGGTLLGPDPADPQQSADFTYCSGGMSWARRLLVRERLDRTGIDSFTRLTADQKQALDRLRQRPDQRLELLQEGPRLLVSLPDGHPSGPAELLLAEDLDEVVLYLDSPRRRFSLALNRLPDLLDQTLMQSKREDVSLDTAPTEQGSDNGEVRPSPRLERLPGIGRRLTSKKGNFTVQYFPEPGLTRAWSLRLTLELLRIDDGSVVEPQPVAPLTLAVPLLAGHDDKDLYEVLFDRGGPVVGWRLTVANESKPARPVQLQTSLEHRGSVRVPLLRFCARRSDYRDVPPRRTSEGPGLAVIAEQELAGLRASTPRGPLEVKNESAHAAWIYADGVLLGWVAAGRQLALRGLPEGFYRIYARSPSAVRAWGPFDVYVPGPLTLR